MRANWISGAERAGLVQRLLADLDRAEADDLAVDLAALLRQEHVGGAAIAAHVLDVQAEHVLGDDGEDDIGRARAGGADARERPLGPCRSATVLAEKLELTQNT